MGTSTPPPGLAGPTTDERSPRAAGLRYSPPKLFAAAAAAAVAVVLAFLLFGSGGSGLGGPIAQAATLSSSTPGYQVHISIQMASPALGSPFTATGSGVVDGRDHATSMSLAMNLPNMPQLIQQLGTSRLQLAMVTVGSTAYVKLPPTLRAALGASGKPWIKVDVAGVSGLPGLSSLGANPTTGDPSRILQSLRSLSNGVVNEGQDRVDGFATTHYHADLPVSQLLAGLPGSAGTRQALTVLAHALPSGGIPVDVWIDGHRLVRRIGMTLELTLPQGPSLQESMTLDIGHYGPQPAPATPPGDQVLTLPSQLTGGG